MFENLTPIEQLDTMLQYMAENSPFVDTNAYHHFDIENSYFYEIAERLRDDGFCTISKYMIKITFNGRLFLQVGGYRQQDNERQLSIATAAQISSQRATYELRLLQATQGAAIGALLVLVWQIVLFYFPDYAHFPYHFWFEKMIK